MIYLKKKVEPVIEEKPLEPTKPKIEPIALIEKTDSLNNDLRNLFNLQSAKINELVEVVNGS